MPAVLIVTGPVGVGKSAVSHEADSLLVESGSRHAAVEIEEIARFWPSAASGDSDRGFVWRNLAALWANFADAGADRILLSGLIEDRSDLRHIERSIPDAELMVVQLRASLSVLEDRVRRREVDPDGELSAARWWFEHLEKVRVGDHVIDTDTVSARAVAVAVLRVAGWFSFD